MNIISARNSLLAVAFLCSQTWSRANIIYSGPEDITISASTYSIDNWLTYSSGGGNPYQIDFNGDGQSDVEVYAATSTVGPFSPVIGTGSINGSAVAGIGYVAASYFAAGSEISLNILFSQHGDWHGVGDPEILETGGLFSGAFKGQNGFFGVQFLSGAETHYGWVGFDGNANGLSGIITGWAYNDADGGSILAGETAARTSAIPEPSTYGFIGAVGLAAAVAFRKRRIPAAC